MANLLKSKNIAKRWFFQMDLIVLLSSVVKKKRTFNVYDSVFFEILHHFNFYKNNFFVSITKQKLEINQSTISTDINLMNWSVSDIEIWSSAFLIWHDLRYKIDNFAISCQLIHLILLDFDFWYYWHRIKIFHHLNKPILHVQNWNVFPKSPDHSIQFMKLKF